MQKELEEKYNIICGIDNKYIEPCATMLNSLFASSPDCNFKIIILSLGISYSNKEFLKDWISKKKQEITFIDINEELLKDFPLKKDDSISLATYLRLFIPKFLPTSIEKALYVDVDLIFQDNIKELYDQDISNYAIAAVEDAPTNSSIKKKYALSNYFNAGVLLLNLDTLRKQHFTESAVDFILENKEDLTFHDQDVLNALARAQIKPLPIKWNLLDCYYQSSPNIQTPRTPDLKKALQNPGIIHFSGSFKPWHAGCFHPLRVLYKKNVPNIPLKTQNFKWEKIHTLPIYQQILLRLNCPDSLFFLMDNLIKKMWNVFKLNRNS